MRGWVIAGSIAVAVAGIVAWQWFKKPAVPATEPTKPSASVKSAAAMAESAPKLSAVKNSSRPAAKGTGVIAGVCMLPGGDVAAGAEVAVASRKSALDAESAFTPLERTVICGDDGGFALEGLPEGFYSIRAGKDGLRAWRSVLLRQPELASWVVLQLEATGEIAGRVLDARGGPVAGARLAPSVRDMGDQSAAFQDENAVQSDADGAFHVDELPEGDWQFDVTANGYAFTRSMAFPTGVMDAVIRLNDGIRLTGRVIEESSGAPAAEVEVVAIPIEESALDEIAYDRGRQSVTTTGADGKFVFDGLAQLETQIEVDDDRFALAGLPVHITGNDLRGHGPVELVVREGAIIRGRVYDNDTLEPLTPDSLGAQCQTAGIRRGARFFDDRPGDYEISGLPTGRYRIGFRVTGYPSSSFYSRTLEVAAGEIYEGIDFALTPGAAIEGTVVHADGTPARYARVLAQGKSQDACAADESGAFRLLTTAQANGLWLVADDGHGTSRPQGPFSVPTKPGETVRLVIDVPLNGIISGQIVDPTGKPLRMTVQAWPADRTKLPRWFARYTTSDRQGVFAIVNLPAGDFDLQLAKFMPGVIGAEMKAASVHLDEGEHRRGVRLVYAPPEKSFVSGTVRDSGGNPLPLIAITVMGTEKLSRGRTDANGNFRVEYDGNLPCLLSAGADGYLPASVRGVEPNSEGIEIVLYGKEEADLRAEVLERLYREEEDAESATPP